MLGFNIESFSFGLTNAQMPTSIDPCVAPASSWYMLYPPRGKQEIGPTFHKPTCYTTQPHTHRGAGRRGPYPHSTTRHTQSQQHTDSKTLRHRAERENVNTVSVAFSHHRKISVHRLVKMNMEPGTPCHNNTIKIGLNLGC